MKVHTACCSVYFLRQIFGLCSEPSWMVLEKTDGQCQLKVIAIAIPKWQRLCHFFLLESCM